MIGLVMIPCNVLRISAPFILPHYGQYYNRHNVIKRHTCHDHQRSHACLTVNILDKGNPEDRRTAPVKCLDKLTLQALICELPIV